MKQFIELIKELRKTPRGKGILFFAFYFIVFLVLIIVIKLNGNNVYKEKEYEVGKPYSFDTTYVESNNYHFEYTITKDSKKYLYVGDKYNDTELFMFDNKEYYYDGEKYYVDKKEVANPYLYSELIEIDNIKKLLELATYDSKTSYESGLTKYNFLLSSNTINTNVYSKDTDIDEVPNSITIGTNNSGILNEITYHLDSYCKYDKDCKDKLEVNLSFDKFGEIEEIVNPLN